MRSLKHSVVIAIPSGTIPNESIQPLRWQLVLGRGQKINAKLQGSTLVLAWLVVLHFRVGLRAYFVPIFPDALSAQQFRRLRVYLRMSCKKAFAKKAAQ